MHTWPGIEAQISALSDDIAYHSHDVNDGLRAGLFTIKDLTDVPIIGPIIAEVQKKYPELQEGRLFHEIGRRLINMMVNDLLSESSKRLADAKPNSADDVRCFGGPLISFSEGFEVDNRSLRKFLFKRMYRHYSPAVCRAQRLAAGRCRSRAGYGTLSRQGLPGLRRWCSVCA